jgi:hypothetical protein
MSRDVRRLGKVCEIVEVGYVNRLPVNSVRFCQSTLHVVSSEVE